MRGSLSFQDGAHMHDFASTPSSSSRLQTPALLYAASPQLTSSSRPHTASWQHAGASTDSAAAMQQENAQLRQYVLRLQEQVSNASMRESLIGSLQQRLVQARQERDQEVRESDALFSQLQEHMRAKQEAEQLRSALSEALCLVRTAAGGASGDGDHEQQAGGSAHQASPAGKAAPATEQLLQELRCAVKDLVQHGQAAQKQGSIAAHDEDESVELMLSAAPSPDPSAGVEGPEQFAAPTLDTVAGAAAQPGRSAALTSGSAARTAAYPEQSAALASNPAAVTAAQSEQSATPASDPVAEAADHPAASAPDPTDVDAAQPAADGERSNRTQRRLDWATCSDRPSLAGHGEAVQGGAAAAQNAAGQGVAAGQRGTAVQGDTAAAPGTAVKGAAAAAQDVLAQSTVAGILQVALEACAQAPVSGLQQSYGSAEVCGVAEPKSELVVTPRKRAQSEGGLGGLPAEQGQATDGQQEQLLQRARELECHAEQLASLLQSAIFVQDATPSLVGEAQAAQAGSAAVGSGSDAGARHTGAGKHVGGSEREVEDDVVSPSDQGDSAWSQHSSGQAPFAFAVPSLAAGMQGQGPGSSARRQADAGRQWRSLHEHGHEEGSEPATPGSAVLGDGQQHCMATGQDEAGAGDATKSLRTELELERLKCHNAQLRLDAFVSRAQLRIARLLPGSSHCTPATPKSARVVRATLSPRAVTVAGVVPRRTCSPPLRPRVLRMGPALAAAAAAAATPNTDSQDASTTPEARSIRRMEDERMRVSSVLQRVHQQRARLKVQVLQLHQRLAAMDKENQLLRRRLEAAGASDAQAGAVSAANAADAQAGVANAANAADTKAGAGGGAAATPGVPEVSNVAAAQVAQAAAAAAATSAGQGQGPACTACTTTTNAAEGTAALLNEPRGDQVGSPCSVGISGCQVESKSEAAQVPRAELEAHAQVAQLTAKLREYQGYLAEAQEEIAKLQNEALRLRQSAGSPAGSSPGTGQRAEQEKEEFMRSKVLQIQEVVRCIMQEKERLQAAHKQQLTQLTQALQQSELQKAELGRKLADSHRAIAALQQLQQRLGLALPRAQSASPSDTAEPQRPKASASAVAESAGTVSSSGASSPSCTPPPASASGGAQFSGPDTVQLTPNPLFEPAAAASGLNSWAAPVGRAPTLAMPASSAADGVIPPGSELRAVFPASLPAAAKPHCSISATPAAHCAATPVTPAAAAASGGAHGNIGAAGAPSAGGLSATVSDSSPGLRHDLQAMSDQEVLAYSQVLKQRILADVTGLSQQLGSVLTQAQVGGGGGSSSSSSDPAAIPAADLSRVSVAAVAGQEGSPVACAFDELAEKLRTLVTQSPAAMSFSTAAVGGLTGGTPGSLPRPDAHALHGPALGGAGAVARIEFSQLPATLQCFAPPSLRAGQICKQPCI